MSDQRRLATPVQGGDFEWDFTSDLQEEEKAERDVLERADDSDRQALQQMGSCKTAFP